MLEWIIFQTLVKSVFQINTATQNLYLSVENKLDTTVNDHRWAWATKKNKTPTSKLKEWLYTSKAEFCSQIIQRS